MRPLQVFMHACEAAGWQVVDRSHGRTQPASVDLLRGRTRLPLTVYCWNISPGGRLRPGEWRVQLTRPETEFRFEPGRLTMAFGVHGTKDVLAFFDLWMKRNASTASPSVFFPAGLVDDAASLGTSQMGAGAGERFAATSTNIDRALAWVYKQSLPRWAVVRPRTIGDYIRHDEENMQVVVRRGSESGAMWLRPGDCFGVVVRRSGPVVEDAFWKVIAIDAPRCTPTVTVTGRLSGWVLDQTATLAALGDTL